MRRALYKFSDLEFMFETFLNKPPLKTGMPGIRETWGKIWHFIWEDNSIWSWILNIILAFVLIKFIVYPGLGLALSTSHPVVAVVSDSMDHKAKFDGWWQRHERVYNEMGITKEEFLAYGFKNGFNKGDIMVLKGKGPESIKAGDVVVFNSGKPDPIIHRVVKIWTEDETYFFQTKGDANIASIKRQDLDETRVSEEQLIGVSLFKIPWLGWVKIAFVESINLFR